MPALFGKESGDVTPDITRYKSRGMEVDIAQSLSIHYTLPDHLFKTMSIPVSYDSLCVNENVNSTGNLLYQATFSEQNV